MHSVVLVDKRLKSVRTCSLRNSSSIIRLGRTVVYHICIQWGKYLIQRIVMLSYSTTEKKMYVLPRQYGRVRVISHLGRLNTDAPPP